MRRAEVTGAPSSELAQTVAAVPPTFTTPPSSHDHSREPAPNSRTSGLPSTSTRKRPGAPSAQLRVRTHTRYSPVLGNATRAFASVTRTPMPCASRYGDPITSMNCASSTHPPASKPCGWTSTRAAPARTPAVAKSTASMLSRFIVDPPF